MSELFSYLNVLSKEIYQNNEAKGFYENEDLFQQHKKDLPEELNVAIEKAFTGQRIALMHSELSEALEADRKDLMDDKLTDELGLPVELADTLIRILDYCGRHEINIGGIVKRKLEYNTSRPYKHGKQY